MSDYAIDMVELKDLSSDEILRLNDWQTSGTSHPFTCANRNDEQHRDFNGDNGALVATKRGWICVWCDYTQSWAHKFMCKETK